MNAPVTFKQKKCKQCGDPFIPARPLQKLCGYLCSVKFAVQQADKAKADGVRVASVALVIIILAETLWNIANRSLKK